MKTNFLFFILSIFFISNAFGQTEPRLSKLDILIDHGNDGDFIIKFSEQYTYDYSGNEKTYLLDYYDNDGIFLSRRGTFYTYNDNESLLLRKTIREYNSTVNIWVTESWTDYTYDANGCEIKQENIQNVGGLNSVLENERNTDCQLTKSTSWVRHPFSDTLTRTGIEEITFFQDGISHEKKIFRINTFTDEVELIRQEKYQFNAAGIIKEREIVDDLHLINDWEGRKVVYTYDQHNNVISRCHYINKPSSPDWGFNYKYIYQNEYDEQFRLVKRIVKNQYELAGELVTNEEGANVEDFTYICEDMLLEKISARAMTGIGNGVRYEYQYEGVNDCFEVENVLLEMSIFPNPTLGNITITSPVFQSGNTMILVFDISGKLLLEKHENHQLLNTGIDLGDLPNGMYVVQLMNQDWFVQEKVVVAK